MTIISKINPSYFHQITEAYLNEQQQVIDSLLKKSKKTILHDLVAAATEAQKNAYAPYSQYQVGAAVLTTDGTIYTGVNAEAISYTQTTHAEESAIRNAVAAGAVRKLGQHFIAAVAFVAPDITPGAPCGHCRQIIREHAENCVVIQGAPDGTTVHVATLNLIFPLAFASINSP